MTEIDESIDTGDTVFHRPTGETWVVAGVVDERLMWCGWPEGYANLADCELIEKATPGRREKLLNDLAAFPGEDSRKRYAVQRLAQNSVETRH